MKRESRRGGRGGWLIVLVLWTALLSVGCQPDGRRAYVAADSLKPLRLR